MADEILVDLEDIFDEVNGWLGDVDVIVARLPALQILATVAVAERLDRIDGRLESLTDFLIWYQAVSPSR